jgi:hypothetical protein
MMTVKSNIVLAIVEMALAVASYVFLKPLIGYWCLIPVAIFGWLTLMATIVSVVMHVANLPDEKVEPDERKLRRRRLEERVFLPAVGLLLIAQLFFLTPRAPERIVWYVFSVLVFVRIFWSDRLVWRRAWSSSADVAPPESDQPEDE